MATRTTHYRTHPSRAALARPVEQLDLRPPEPRSLFVETDHAVDVDGEPRTSWHWTTRPPGKPA